MTQSAETPGGAVLPTIGIEIELPWKTMLRRVNPEAADVLQRYGSYWRLTDEVSDPDARALLETGFAQVDEVYLPKVAQALESGIDKGGDGFVEFAHRPKHDYHELLSEVDSLYELDLLRPGEQYPLHVTLGDVQLSKEAYWLLLGCELLDPTLAERLAEARSWAVKGQGGIRQRTADELQLGAPYGVEFRTLRLSDRETLAHTLRLAQLGGAAVRAMQERSQVDIPEWADFTSVLQAFADASGININRKWQNPGGEPQLWRRYAQGHAQGVHTERVAQSAARLGDRVLRLAIAA